MDVRNEKLYRRMNKTCSNSVGSRKKTLIAIFSSCALIQTI